MKKFTTIISCVILVMVFVSGCENKAAKENAEAVKAELVKAQSDLAMALKENKTLTQAVEDFKAKVATMTDMDAVKEQIETLSKEKEALTKQLSDASAKMSALSDQAKEYTSKIKQLSEANSKLQSMLDELKAKAGDAVNDATKDIQMPLMK